MYFSSEVGAADFESRVSVHANGPKKRPKLLINTEIHGPWSAYTTVWRCLLAPVSSKKSESDLNYFMF
jgi:hypothetical protein